MGNLASASQEHVFFDFVAEHSVQGLSIACKQVDLQQCLQISLYGRGWLKMFVIEMVLGQMSKTVKNSVLKSRTVKRMGSFAFDIYLKVRII